MTEDLVLGKGYEGRTVIVDRFFTSSELGKSLLINRMGMVGTIRANKRCIPPALRNVGERKIFSSRFAHSNDATMVSYYPKKNKNVLLYSTVHYDQKVDTDDEKRKPAMVAFYNRNKGAVDTVDRRIASYSVKRATHNWMTVVFCNGVDLSLNNAFILYDEIHKGWSQAKDRRRTFMENLAKALISEHIKRRERNPRAALAAQIVSSVKSQASSDQQLSVTTIQQGEAHVQKRGRCRFCTSSDNKHSNVCFECVSTVCKQHATTLCPDCYDAGPSRR